jgi:hypothetical protein
MMARSCQRLVLRHFLGMVCSHEFHHQTGLESRADLNWLYTSWSHDNCTIPVTHVTRTASMHSYSSMQSLYYQTMPPSDVRHGYISSRSDGVIDDSKEVDPCQIGQLLHCSICFLCLDSRMQTLACRSRKARPSLLSLHETYKSNFLIVCCTTSLKRKQYNTCSEVSDPL